MAKQFTCLKKISNIDADSDKHSNMTETQKYISEEGLSFCECSDCWVLNNLKLIMLGLKDPVQFLKQCLATLRDIEESQKMGKAFKILSDIGERKKQELETGIKTQRIKKQQTIYEQLETKEARRHSTILNPNHV